MERTIKLGQHDDVVVTEQSVPYLVRELGGDFLKSLATSDPREIAGRLAGLGELYRVLALFIPDLERAVPEHEFHGFRTEDGWKANEGFDRELGWTMPQLFAAIEAVWEVNDLGRLGVLENLAARFGLNPQMLGEALNGLADEAQKRLTQETDTPDSPHSSTSPSPNGESGSTKPSGTAPIANGHAASPSAVS